MGEFSFSPLSEIPLLETETGLASSRKRDYWQAFKNRFLKKVAGNVRLNLAAFWKPSITARENPRCVGDIGMEGSARQQTLSPPWFEEGGRLSSDALGRKKVPPS